MQALSSVEASANASVASCTLLAAKWPTGKCITSIIAFWTLQPMALAMLAQSFTECGLRVRVVRAVLGATLAALLVHLTRQRVGIQAV
eukprot:6445108-Heterocapsa_arctica.AAC.1